MTRTGDSVFPLSCMPRAAARARVPLAVLLALLTVGCHGITPSDRLTHRVNIPVPEATAPAPERLTLVPHGDTLTLTARALVDIAFHAQPDIKASYENFRSEEARYDFFYVSRDSLTPQLRADSRFDEARDPDDVLRERTHAVTLAMEKRFFDTTELDVGVGYRTDINGGNGRHPFVLGRLRYPLWASREKLGRTSEDIFRRNELDDAQLAYIQQVRTRLQDVLFRFYETVQQQRNLAHLRAWLSDLEKLAASLDEVVERDAATDRQRVRAELARVNSEIRNLTGRHEIDVQRLKGAAGVPFFTPVELEDDAFNPFTDGDHATLLRLSMATDPEIATLRNALRNAEVQLDLARRGRWDIAVTLDGRTSLEGRGNDNGLSDWSVAAGFEVSAVDPRVTDSLTRQAQANIARFQQAIAARENVIFVDTLEPLVRIETLSASRDELTDNLPRNVQDYDNGVRAFFAGTLNIDDLLRRRETIVQRQQEIAELSFLVGANVAELCSATGKFFELLAQTEPSTLRPPQPAPSS